MEGLSYNKKSILEKLDETPTADSTNAVTSGGVKSYVDQADGVLSGRISDATVQIAAKINFKGAVADVANLPGSGNLVNDTYYVSTDGSTEEYRLYSWNGTAWAPSSLSETEYLQIMKTLRNNLADDYSDQSTYQVGNFCVYQNEVYVCKTAINAAESWTPAHWERVVFANTLDDIILVQDNQPTTAANKIWLSDNVPEGIEVPEMDDIENIVASEYDNTKTYAVGEYCIYNDLMYKCTTAITTHENWTAGHWTQVQVGTEITNVNNALVNDLNYAGLVSIPMLYIGRYYNNGGETIDPDVRISSGNFDCTAIDCTSGDIFTINATSGGPNGVPWAFIDSSNNVLLKSTVSVAGTYEHDSIITAPLNAAKLLINNRKASTPDAKSFYGQNIVSRENLSDLRFETIETELTALNIDGTNIDLPTNTTHPLGFRSGYFSHTTGNSSTSGNYSRTYVELPVPPMAKTITIYCPTATSSSGSVVAFSSASPSFTNNADNSEIFIWGKSLKSKQTLSFDVVSGEHYFISINIKYADLTSNDIPIVKWYSDIGGELLVLNEKIDTEVENLETSISITDTHTKAMGEGFALLYEGYTLDPSEYSSGRPTIHYDVSGNPYVTLETSENYKTSKMFACPKNGKLRVDATNNLFGIVTFYDTLDDLTSVQWITSNAYTSRNIYEINSYGNYFTFSQNTGGSLKLPTIYANANGSGYVPVTPFVSDEISLRNKIFSDIDENTLVLTCVADIHYNEHESRGYNQRKLINDLTQISSRLGVDAIVALGDMYDENYFDYSNTKPGNEIHAKEMIQIFKNTNLPFLYVQGHHEMYPLQSSGNGTNTWRFPRERCFGILGRYMRYANAKYHTGSSSYYVDFEHPKIRFIALDSTSYGANGFSSSVVSWYEDVLSTTPSDYGVVIASHCAVIEYSTISVTNGTAIKDATLNYIAQGGNVLCHVHGHYHRDNYNIIGTGDNTYPLISLGCQTRETKGDNDAMSGMEHYSATPDRTFNTINEYLFDVICIHRDTGVINAFRFGAGADLILT